MAMALYSQCFNWIICRINSRIRGRDDFKSISILDIFGFENFEVRLGVAGAPPPPRPAPVCRRHVCRFLHR